MVLCCPSICGFTPRISEGPSWLQLLAPRTTFLTSANAMPSRLIHSRGPRPNRSPPNRPRRRRLARRPVPCMNPTGWCSWSSSRKRNHPLLATNGSRWTCAGSTGFAFGLGGIGAAVLGQLTDLWGHCPGLPDVRLSAADRPACGVSTGSASSPGQGSHDGPGCGASLRRQTTPVAR
ncbi:hypothetical protein Thiowin_03540 [Thiorhodovibrio winogradskyi]|uniref:Major facilitator superfamily (MFS) profile domain-containing protein n=1 Tax=Thiorhodovibrio winogradskyi TaxID=77007 RepID=A0ABZ0SC56_9GAMM